MEHLFLYQTDFKPWTLQHVIPLIIFTIIGILMIYLGKNRWNHITQWRYPYLSSLLLPVSIILWIFLRLWRREFDLNDDLPLHMCNIITFFLPLIFLKKKPYIFGILYFWVMAGTLQAILTPGLEQAFPHFWYFRYWLIHCGLVILILYAIIVLHYRPRLKDIGIAFLAMNIFFVLVHSFNLIAETNYLFTMSKPSQPTLLDHLGPWPWYILSSEFIALLFFIIYYLPFIFIPQKKSR